MKLLFALLVGLSFFAGQAQAQAKADKADEKSFVQLFDGKSLTGWKLMRGHGTGYVIKDGTIVCPLDGGGNLYTEKEYANFIFRFEFKTEPGGSNGCIGAVPHRWHHGDALIGNFIGKSHANLTALSVHRAVDGRLFQSNERIGHRVADGKKLVGLSHGSILNQIALE